MYHVHYYENKNLLLCQVLQQVPSEGEQLKIKGRKGTVLNVMNVEGDKYQVQVQLEIKKKKAALDDPKKKKKR